MGYYLYHQNTVVIDIVCNTEWWSYRLADTYHLMPGPKGKTTPWIFSFHDLSNMNKTSNWTLQSFTTIYSFTSFSCPKKNVSLLQSKREGREPWWTEVSITLSISGCQWCNGRLYSGKMYFRRWWTVGNYLLFKPVGETIHDWIMKSFSYEQRHKPCRVLWSKSVKFTSTKSFIHCTTLPWSAGASTLVFSFLILDTVDSVTDSPSSAKCGWLRFNTVGECSL